MIYNRYLGVGIELTFFTILLNFFIPNLYVNTNLKNYNLEHSNYQISENE